MTGKSGPLITCMGGSSFTPFRIIYRTACIYSSKAAESREVVHTYRPAPYPNFILSTLRWGRRRQTAVSQLFHFELLVLPSCTRPTPSRPDHVHNIALS
eukprot:sb/3478614/